MTILLFQLQKTAFAYYLSDVNVKKHNSSFILLTESYHAVKSESASLNS